MKICRVLRKGPVELKETPDTNRNNFHNRAVQNLEKKNILELKLILQDNL